MRTTLPMPVSLWCAANLTASIDGPALQRVYSLAKPFILVGSSPQCDIVVPLVDIAPVALCILVTDDSVHWIDLASPTGQWRSGAFGNTGCLVWRGYHLELRRNCCAADSSASDAPDSAEKRTDRRTVESPVFDISFDGEQFSRAKVTHALTLVGHSDRCRIRLRSRHVAAEHCLLYVAKHRVWVIDLLGNEGTYLRGKPVSAGEVHTGDVITVGKPRLTLLRWTKRKSIEALASAIATEPAADQVLQQAIDLAVGESAVEPVDASADMFATAAEGAAMPFEKSGDPAESSQGAPPQPESPDAPPSVRDTVFDGASSRDTIIDIDALCEAVSEAALPPGAPIANPETSRPLLACDINRELTLTGRFSDAAVEARSSDIVTTDRVEFVKEPIVDDSATMVRSLALLPPPNTLPSPDENAGGDGILLLPANVVAPTFPSQSLQVLSAAETVPADTEVANLALDRLIVRHRKIHRRRVLVWSAAAALLFSAFLTGVRWATENFDFHETTFEFNLEATPPESTQPEFANQSTPANQPSSGDSAIEVDRLDIPVRETR